MNEQILEVVVSNVFEIILGVVSIIVSVYLIPLIKTELKPWLEEKRVYNLISKFVEAAEKLAETGVIQRVDKKAKVVELLKENGVEVTPTIEAFIESAVKQLDLVIDTVVDEVKNEETPNVTE